MNSRMEWSIAIGPSFKIAILVIPIHKTIGMLCPLQHLFLIMKIQKMWILFWSMPTKKSLVRVVMEIGNLFP